jgi:hypothetical protein
MNWKVALDTGGTLFFLVSMFLIFVGFTEFLKTLKPVHAILILLFVPTTIFGLAAGWSEGKKKRNKNETT